MGVEIERKFLVKNNNWMNESLTKMSIKQGYLNSNMDRTVRIRILGDQGYLTIKGKTNNLTRKEFEYAIPAKEALELLLLCEKPLIEKTRYVLSANDLLWEIDVFEGENEGLTVAEVELSSENEEFIIPEWIGKEVSLESKYYNSSLILNPFKNWN